MRQLQKKLKSGTLDTKDDPFELFVAATTIRYCYYSETHKILGSTYGMCVLQVRARDESLPVSIYLLSKRTLPPPPPLPTPTAQGLRSVDAKPPSPHDRNRGRRGDGGVPAQEYGVAQAAVHLDDGHPRPLSHRSP